MMMHYRNLAYLLAGVIILTITNSAFAIDISLPAFKCMLTNKLDAYDWPGSAQETFYYKTPKIYFMCYSKTAFRGDSIKAVWVADHLVAKPFYNKVIAVKTSRNKASTYGDQTFDADLSLARPGNAWPRGSYHIQLYINGIESDTYYFSVR